MVPYRYYYQKLGPNARQVYRLLYDGISKEKNQVIFSCYPGWEADLSRIQKALCYDNPHLYRWDFELLRTWNNGMQVTVFLQYTDQHLTDGKLERKMNEILSLSGISRDLSEREKLERLHDHLAQVWTYGFQPENYAGVYRIAGPLINQIGVCQGFAFCLKLFCDYLHIKCRVCDGWIGIDIKKENLVPEQPNHAWNKVRIDKQWYYIDMSQDIANSRDEICRRWFLLSEEEIKEDHLFHTVKSSFAML